MTEIDESSAAASPVSPRRFTNVGTLVHRARIAGVSPSIRWAALLAAFATVCMWPVHALEPTPGLDTGWIAGLAFARGAGMQFGRDISFTYGPLGFALFPNSVSRFDLVASLLTVAALTGTFAVLTFRLLRAHLMNETNAVLATIVVILIAPSAGYILAEMVTFALLATMIDLTLNRRNISPLWNASGGALTAVLLLSKVSTGIVAVVGIAVFCVADRRRGLRIAVTCAGFLGTFSVLWIALGQGISNIWSWLLDLESLSTGFGAAMGVDEPLRRWELLLAGFVALVLIASAVAVTVGRIRKSDSSRRSVSQLVSAGLLVALAFEFAFKEGFVRHDGGHVMVFLLGLVYFLATLTSWSLLSRAREVLAGCLIGSVLCLLVSTNTGIAATLDPSLAVGSFVQVVNDLVSKDAWHSQLIASRAKDKAFYQVPPEILQDLDGHSVHVDPYDLAVVWAYNLGWKPVPIFQRYSAYTLRLDSIDAARLSAPAGPQRVLRSTDSPIDGRFDFLDAPGSVRSLLCDFRPLTQTDRYQVLAKSDHRCGSIVELGSTRVSAGEELRAPSIDATTQALLVSINYTYSPLKRLYALIYKDDKYMMTVDGIRFRVVPATVERPGLVYIPPSSGWSRRFREFLIPPSQFSFDHDAVVSFLVMDVNTASALPG